MSDSSKNFFSSRVAKRIVVCCDGTWQDGIVDNKRWQYSNVLKLSRSLKHQDSRQHPPIPQIVFYQTGVGTAPNLYSKWVEGATGASLAEKVQEAYGFIAHNYHSGDEVFLFGFSRGAYTARMVAAFIGEIGVLDRKDMDHFGDIFVWYQKRGSATSQKEKDEYNEKLKPWNSPEAQGRKRADADGDTFTIKCLGVWDTVGSIGLPKEVTFSQKFRQLFGFQDKILGDHVQHAFHAIALNEQRADFDVAKFEQTQKGREKGQILKQVWFSGAHTDVGGGYKEHDLADVTLVWMAANIHDMVALDVDYLCSIPKPFAPWGTLKPHNSRTSIFELSKVIRRALPTQTDNVTCEFIHPSAMSQSVVPRRLQENVKANPALVASLLPLEERVRTEWPYTLGGTISATEEQTQAKGAIADQVKKAMGLETEVMKNEAGQPSYAKTWLGSIVNKVQGLFRLRVQ